MGYLYLFEHPGEDGGTWYGAQYPLGATHYYRTEQARTLAVDRYRRAIEVTSGEGFVVGTYLMP